jgi:hypothetical protein
VAVSNDLCYFVNLTGAIGLRAHVVATAAEVLQRLPGSLVIYPCVMYPCFWRLPSLRTDSCMCVPPAGLRWRQA